MSELSLIAYVHMSKRVTILMLRICYNYIILVSIYLKLAYFIAALQVKSQPEDGPHIGPKHVVVFLLYY